MANVEKMAETAMEIVTYAGMAKSSYLQGLAAAKEGNYGRADELIKEGDGSFVQAHHAHVGLLQEEMVSLEPQISLLMAHAEDQLMGAETIKTMVSELIELYRGGVNHGGL